MTRSQLTPFHNPKLRLLGAGVTTAIAIVLLPEWLSLLIRLLAAWDAGMIGLLVLTWWVMLRSTPAMMRKVAQQQDVSRLVISMIVTTAACVSVLAIALMLQEGKQTSPLLFALYLTLSLITILSAWMLVHTIFALHYAHGYYRDGSQSLQQAKAEELDFPGEVEPDYWDFLYFSFVIGMTSQVSDVEIISRSLRKLALFHSILSFFFNTMILAMSINLVASLIQRDK
jgi:uncharacterized membrane protein